MNEYDYVSNVDEGLRTSPDGYDCEVISSPLLKWAHENSDIPYDREHVTTKIRSSRPDWAKLGFVMGYMDHSDIKISLDEPSQISDIERRHFAIEDKYRRACEKYGKKNVHRL